MEEELKNIDEQQQEQPPQPEPTEAKAPEKPREKDSSGGRSRQRTLLIRYGMMGMVGQFRHSEREIPSGVTHVILNTERGMEIGEIISPFCHKRANVPFADEELDHYFEVSGPNYPFSRTGRIVRFATEQDLNEQRHLLKNAQAEKTFCEELIEKYNLNMKLVAVEHLFGGDRIIYYFMSEGRVDFRNLVKELAQEYQTRIEMRQVGARDEARLIADFEVCGRQCCCKNFLKVLQPVNMKMAKLQKTTLDPSKISGRCGRLKCCLRYENEVYEILQEHLPRQGSCVLVEKGYGIVVETQVLTQLVKIRMKDNRIIAVANDEILQRNCRIPNENEQPMPPQVERAKPEAKEPVRKEEAEQPPEESSDAEPRKKKRRRRKRKKKKSGDAAGGDDANGSNQQGNDG
jgi:cell fate regulator YaaT (PSP1 superfamily)